MLEQKKAVVVQPDGTAEVIEFTDENGLKTLQTAVDGYIESVMLDPNFVMWVNEEGLIRKDLKSNWLGATLYEEAFQIKNPINGTIVFTGGADAEGFTLGLEEWQVEAAKQMAELAFRYSHKDCE